MKLLLKPRARSDLVALREWSEANWGPQKTSEFIEGLLELFERLQEHPHLGRARPAFHDDLRSLRYKVFVIFYVVEDGKPVIVAVLHEKRNHAALDFAERIEDG